MTEITHSRRGFIAAGLILLAGCGGGPAAGYLKEFERAVVTLEKKADSGGKFTIGDMEEWGTRMRALADKLRPLSESKQGMSGSQRTKYMQLVQRMGEAMETITARMMP
jgi:hypothetical protein